jgi:hypothetical protein
MSPKAANHEFSLPTLVQELPNVTMERPMPVEVPKSSPMKVIPEYAAARGLHIVASHNKLSAELETPEPSAEEFNDAA